MNHTGTVVTPAPDRSAYLRWVGGQAGMDARQKSVGPAIALAVKAGDRVQLSAWARFKSSEAAFSKTPISGIIASALAGQYAYSNGLESTVQAANAFNAGLLGLANPSEDADDGRPYAYLNYIVFNSSYAKVDGGAKRVPQGAGFTEAQRANGYGPNNLVKFDKAVEISQPGYIYIWVSNESENTEVWFDDINVIHQKTLIAQATDYETWGGVLREQKWEDMEGEYRYGYQGKYAEKDEETGWEHFELREYDPVIGRWMVRDPRRQYWSPYLAMGNNPMNRVDPTGGTDGPDPKDGSLNKAGTHTWDSKTKGWVKTLDEVVVTAKSGFNWKAAPVPQDATRFVIARVPPGINPSREKIGRGGVNITGEGARPDGFNAGRNIGGNRTIAEEEWSIYDWMAALFSNYQSTNNGSDQIIDANQLLHHEAHGNPATPQIDTVYTGTVYFTSTLNTNTRLGNYIKRFGINRSTGDTIKLDPKQLDPSVYPSGSSYPK
jgi:RHS repeat-associated protein